MSSASTSGEPTHWHRLIPAQNIFGLEIDVRAARSTGCAMMNKGHVLDLLLAEGRDGAGWGFIRMGWARLANCPKHGTIR